MAVFSGWATVGKQIFRWDEIFDTVKLRLGERGQRKSSIGCHPAIKYSRASDGTLLIATHSHFTTQRVTWRQMSATPQTAQHGIMESCGKRHNKSLPGLSDRLSPAESLLDLYLANSRTFHHHAYPMHCLLSDFQVSSHYIDIST